MKREGNLLLFMLSAAVFFLPAASNARKSSDDESHPSAERIISGEVLPPAAQPFGGMIHLNAAESTPDWPATVVPPRGVPNVLLIITDDVGFGAPSTFGGIIQTPALDRIAQTGLRYTRFHSTGMSAPTRAAVLTGRNHHAVGFGVSPEIATGYPGYNSILPKSAATIGQILKQHGYATSWFGKNDTTPLFQTGPAGPFDQWPTGLGFEHFYGFLGSQSSQWQPSLYRNTTPIASQAYRYGWNLTTALADEAIGHITMLTALSPEKPFFMYYAPGGAHAPHHPTTDWIQKFKGKFDKGWNDLREQIFNSQKQLGLIPKNAQLPRWPKEVPHWDSLPEDEKKMYARQAEVYGAYLAYTDFEIGRVIQALEDLGRLDNTLIIYISGACGASAEGDVPGTANLVASENGIIIPLAEQLKSYDRWGSDRTYPHMGAGWALAFNTPFKWTKTIASHFGGTRQGLCVSWPTRIKNAGGIRSQFHHVIDIAPTVLEAAGIAQPERVNGIGQQPIDGVSMVYSFDNETADTASRTQYFELLGNRALYHDGWMACTMVDIPPWRGIFRSPTRDPAHGYNWELYDVASDWTQINELAASKPDKLRELQELFWIEAVRHQVLPLNAFFIPRLFADRPGTERKLLVFSDPIAGIAPGKAPSLLNRSYSITADIEIPPAGAEGILATQGGRFGGWGFYLLRGKPVFLWNLAGLQRARWESPDTVPPGRHKIEFSFRYEIEGAHSMAQQGDINGLGKGGTGKLMVDGRMAATLRMEKTLPLTLLCSETFDVGADTGTPVEDSDYQVPFAFTGRLHQLAIVLDPPGAPELDKQEQKK